MDNFINTNLGLAGIIVGSVVSIVGIINLIVIKVYNKRMDDCKANCTKSIEGLQVQINVLDKDTKDNTKLLHRLLGQSIGKKSNA